jgi:hypothetical protein
MDKVPRFGWALISSSLTFFLTFFPAAAQNKLIFRQQTGSQILRVEVWEDHPTAGRTLQIEMSDGERYRAVYDSSDSVVEFQFEDPAVVTAYSALRLGNMIQIDGVLKGKAVSRTLQVDAHPWFESMEQSLQHYAISGSSQPLLFWCVIPSDATAFLLMARIIGTEEILVNERKIMAVKVKVSLPGIASIFWGVLFWYRPADGTFLRYEGVRGFIGTPKTVLELAEGYRLDDPWP